MALTQRHRSSIFGALAPIMGEEEAEALLSQFPAHDLEQPVTKEFLRAELAVTRTEMHDEIVTLGVEMHQLVQRQRCGSFRRSWPLAACWPRSGRSPRTARGHATRRRSRRE